MDDNTFELAPTAAPSPAALVANPGPADLLRIAVQQGASIDQLERLMALQERFNANEAKKAYHEAMAQFQTNEVKIGKDKHVSFTTSKGKTEYDHATLGNIVKTVKPLLASYGLSSSWEPARSEGGRVVVTCRVTHKQGHTESVTLDGPIDDSGGKNNIQALGSTVTYLQRYTLLAILGLATEDEDNDGAGSAAYVSECQLQDFIAKVNEATTDAGVMLVWQLGRDALGIAKNVKGVDELRGVVEAKRKALKATNE